MRPLMRVGYGALFAPLVALTVILAGCSSAGPDIELTATDRMKDYLLVNYDASLGLVRESPNAHPHVYWLFSDNYLAYLALKETEPETADAIKQALEGYEFHPSERWKALNGEVVSADLFATGVVVVTIAENGEEIRTEVPDPQIHMDDWQEYADRLLVAAINASNDGDEQEALSLFEKAQDMFDGTGLADKVYVVDDHYNTYKLALYLLAAEALDIELADRQEVENLILSLQETDPQSNRFGGIYTEYDENGEPFPHTDANTETTSLALLALS